jgi:acyl carrier protein
MPRRGSINNKDEIFYNKQLIYNNMNIEEKLRELLIPVFGLNTIDEIKPEHSLVLDLGAASIDFVEIAYIIESNFNVQIKTNELMIGGTSINPDDIFVEGLLTADGANMMNKNINSNRFKQGQTKRELFEAITVADLAKLVEERMKIL